MKYIMTALLLLSLCSVAKAEESCDPVSTEVLHKLQARLGDTQSGFSLYLDGAYGPSEKQILLHQQKEIDKVRLWAEGMEPGRVRSSYLGWLDFWASQNAEALNEWATHKEEKEAKERDRHQAECDRKAREYTATHKIPSPPK